jgi:hypothetical protein
LARAPIGPHRRDRAARSPGRFCRQLIAQLSADLNGVGNLLRESRELSAGSASWTCALPSASSLAGGVQLPIQLALDGIELGALGRDGRGVRRGTGACLGQLLAGGREFGTQFFADLGQVSDLLGGAGQVVVDLDERGVWVVSSAAAPWVNSGATVYRVIHPCPCRPNTHNSRPPAASLPWPASVRTRPRFGVWRRVATLRHTTSIRPPAPGHDPRTSVLRLGRTSGAGAPRTRGADRAHDLRVVRGPRAQCPGRCPPGHPTRVRPRVSASPGGHVRPVNPVMSARQGRCPPRDVRRVRPDIPGSRCPPVRCQEARSGRPDKAGCPLTVSGEPARAAGRRRTRTRHAQPKPSRSGAGTAAWSRWARPVQGRIDRTVSQGSSQDPRQTTICRVLRCAPRGLRRPGGVNAGDRRRRVAVHGESPHGRLTKSHRLSQCAHPELTGGVANVYARARARIEVSEWISRDFELRRETTWVRRLPGVAKRGY